MSKIKLEIVNAATFKCAGKAYPKGKYLPEYDETSTGKNGLLTDPNSARVFLRPMIQGPGVKPPFKNPRPWTDFLDSKGKPYADFSTFTEALQTVITDIETK